MERAQDRYVQHRPRSQMSQPDQWSQRVWPGVRRAGLPRQSPALTPGQRRRRRRLDPVRLNSAALTDGT